MALGADLAPGTLLAAYRAGLFPMPLDPPGAAGGSAASSSARRRRPAPPVLGWWSPDPRGVLPLDGLVVSRSLRRSLRRYELRVDTAFDAVVAACADPSRPHGWITGGVAEAYGLLHRLGWAHSVEAWTPAGELVGGLYGVSVGGLFAGESMFSTATDASKAALVGLVGLLVAAGAAGRLLDVQWSTPHLASLGVVDVPRAAYLARARTAVDLPRPPFPPGPLHLPAGSSVR